jgi:hypothetical protein
VFEDDIGFETKPERANRFFAETEEVTTEFAVK